MVLIHGMSHGAWCFHSLQKLLASRGHASFAIQLKSAKAKPLAVHVDEVHAALAALSLAASCDLRAQPERHHYAALLLHQGRLDARGATGCWLGTACYSRTGSEQFFVVYFI